MIAYLEGKILKKDSERILLLVNQIGYEVLLPRVVMESLAEKSKGDYVSFYIYFHQTERQPKPVLIGFNSEAEREFFQHFISVEAIGPIKAAQALILPIEEIAEAIESGDAQRLSILKGIGKRTAQKILATLQGKMEKFIAASTEKNLPKNGNIKSFDQQVLNILVNQLGHRLTEAKEMIAKALKQNKNISSPEALLDEIYRGEK